MSMSVNGSVVCPRSTECEPSRVYSLDSELELCVCKHCGQGWVRDVDPWARFSETIDRIKRLVDEMRESTAKMVSSFDALKAGWKTKP